ncbi:Methionyl-tRNA formyltransferase protein [Marine Group I thaumarchaeote SCGC RSA3]|uniref:Bifunctional polymyxin resistance protein ArnA n=2 Tax=Marine Group I TaxID=905826 RepID=A0A087RM36_9ARCH|nr:Bifunctional polymyxin resistance protein ArnA [Marine Group I thaumarchaeote SCGC AAA799-D11]KFM19934.1 Methionyl-tRNA formyltransferase protein [Marine Group I thaumarchaeote SCGC RSA3]
MIKKEKFSLALIGRTEWLLNTGKLLHENGFKIKIIISSKNAEWDPISPQDFKKFSQKINSKYIFTENINSSEIKKQIKDLNLDLGISVNNRLLISKEMLSLFGHGILNAHPGDLPRFRGNACPNWAILKDEKRIGLTVHFMDEKLDNGDIIKKDFIKINDSTTILEVYNFLNKQIPNSILESVKKIHSGKYRTTKQDNKKMLRTYPRNKIDGKIDWSKSADYIHRIIRISGEPFFGAYTYLGSTKLILLNAKKEYPKYEYFSEFGQIVERRKNGEIVVSCLDGFVVITKVKFKNKIYDRPSEVIKTVYTRLGMDVEGEIEKILEKLENLSKNR